jgi:hypothetical protein
MYYESDVVSRNEITRARHGHTYLLSATKYPFWTTPALANDDVVLTDLVPENCVLDAVKIWVQGPAGVDFSGLVVNGFVANHDALDWPPPNPTAVPPIPGIYTPPDETVARPFRTGAIGAPFGIVNDVRLFWHDNTFAQERLNVNNRQYVALHLPNITSYVANTEYQLVTTCYFRPFQRGVDQRQLPW